VIPRTRNIDDSSRTFIGTTRVAGSVEKSPRRTRSSGKRDHIAGVTCDHQKDAGSRNLAAQVVDNDRVGAGFQKGIFRLKDQVCRGKEVLQIGEEKLLRRRS
jgi:hypothetical protein